MSKETKETKETKGIDEFRSYRKRMNERIFESGHLGEQLPRLGRDALGVREVARLLVGDRAVDRVSRWG